MARRKAKNAIAGTAPALPPPSSERFWKPWWLFGGALAAALIAFGPALHGSFIFDDFHLPFADRHAAEMTARGWLGGVRPILMATYWVNFLISGTDTFSYHVGNVLLHAMTAVLVFFILERLFSLTETLRNPKAYSLASAAIFLLHPLQTESVDYIAGRSEVVSGLLFCAAWLIFLKAFESETRIMTSAGILVLGGAAVLSKENAICLPAILLATDVFWAKRPFGAQMARRAKLYVPFALGGVAGAALILKSLTASTSAGFSSGATPAQYALTQCRSILTYCRLFFVPIGQNGDWQLPLFRTPAEGGAWLYVLGLLALICAIVWSFSRYRLVAFGLLIFLLMLAPTSSVVPIKDALAERRMYMPVIGLIVASVGAVSAIADRYHLKTGQLRALAALALLAFAGLSWRRSSVWSGPLAFWSDSAMKNPANSRAHLGLGAALMAAHECNPAVVEFTLARAQDPSNPEIVWNLGEALQCTGEFDRALAVLEPFASSRPSSDTWNQVAYLEARLGHSDATFAAVDKALSLDPNNATSYAYRGLARLAAGNSDGARGDLAHALHLDPHNAAALEGNQRIDALKGR